MHGRALPLRVVHVDDLVDVDGLLVAVARVVRPRALGPQGPPRAVDYRLQRHVDEEIAERGQGGGEDADAAFDGAPVEILGDDHWGDRVSEGV